MFGGVVFRGLMAESNPKELIFSGITIYTDKDFTRAKEYFEKACRLNDADGCTILREAYSNGGVILKGSARESIEKALEHTATAKACKSNDAEKCKDLAEFYFNANDIKNALEYYSKSCKLNNVEGCMLSATFYNDMIKGLKKDKKDLEYYSKACELNEALTCTLVGEFYRDGEGVAKDEKQTTENLEKSCKLGLKEACDILKEQKQ